MESVGVEAAWINSFASDVIHVRLTVAPPLSFSQFLPFSLWPSALCQTAHRKDPTYPTFPICFMVVLFCALARRKKYILIVIIIHSSSFC